MHRTPQLCARGDPRHDQPLQGGDEASVLRPNRINGQPTRSIMHRISCTSTRTWSGARSTLPSSTLRALSWRLIPFPLSVRPIALARIRAKARGAGGSRCRWQKLAMSGPGPVSPKGSIWHLCANILLGIAAKPLAPADRYPGGRPSPRRRSIAGTRTPSPVTMLGPGTARRSVALRRRAREWG